MNHPPLRVIRSFLLLVLIVFAGSACQKPVEAGEVHWSIPYARALERGKAEGKSILLDFGGSKWCPACILMEKTVLSTKEFKDYAAKNLVFVSVDFETPESLPAQGDPTFKYRVEYFPTFILLDKNGGEIGRQVGLVEGGPGTFIKLIESFKK